MEHSEIVSSCISIVLLDMEPSKRENIVFRCFSSRGIAYHKHGKFSMAENLENIAIRRKILMIDAATFPSELSHENMRNFWSCHLIINRTCSDDGRFVTL